MKRSNLAFALLVLLPACGLIARGCGVVDKMEDDAATTVVTEYSPSAMLRKYEWFKNTAAALDARKADILVYEARFATIKAAYGTDASDWPRDVRESFAQQTAELAGMKASFNNLAADYNAQMSKFNWATFERFGNAPQGAAESLPREFKPYVLG